MNQKNLQISLNMFRHNHKLVAMSDIEKAIITNDKYMTGNIFNDFPLFIESCYHYRLVFDMHLFRSLFKYVSTVSGLYEPQYQQRRTLIKLSDEFAEYIIKNAHTLTADDLLWCQRCCFYLKGYCISKESIKFLASMDLLFQKRVQKSKNFILLRSLLILHNPSNLIGKKFLLKELHKQILI